MNPRYLLNSPPFDFFLTNTPKITVTKQQFYKKKNSHENGWFDDLTTFFIVFYRRQATFLVVTFEKLAFNSIHILLTLLIENWVRSKTLPDKKPLSEMPLGLKCVGQKVSREFLKHLRQLCLSYALRSACSGKVKAETAENIMKFGFLNSLVKFLYFCPYFSSLQVFQK